MKILPAEQGLPVVARPLRHDPPIEDYGHFRQCLRWDFGFTCAFCLLHEADLAEYGVEGTGTTAVEHWIPRSTRSDLANQYSNCLYICRYCNGARSNRPVVGGSGTLLDPRVEAWSEHFEVRDFEMFAKIDDPDAEYTADTYDFADRRKTAMRRGRAQFLAFLWKVLEDPELPSAALRAVADTQDPVERDRILDDVERFELERRLALRQASRFLAVPADAKSCRCAAPAELPAWLSQQLVEVPDILEP